MSDHVRHRTLSFPIALVAFAWLGIAVLGPIGLLLTWYGDCFAVACPAPTEMDRLVYGIDVVAGIAIGVVGALAVVGRHRPTFILLAALGVAFAAQGVSGIVGARGFYAFPIILPAAFLLIGGALVGLQALRPVPPPWAEGSMTKAVGIGCSVYVGSYLAFIGGLGLATGTPVGMLFFALVLAGFAVLGLLIRVRRGRARLK
jgi:hypothetical protein